MSYTDHPNGAFLTRAGNYNVDGKILDQEFTLIRYFSAAVDNLSSGAFYKIWSVPANFMLLEAYIANVAAEGAGDTIDLVDDDSATTTFVTNANLNSAGTITATNARKHYASAGFLVLRPDAALTVATFYVMVKGIITNIRM